MSDSIRLNRNDLLELTNNPRIIRALEKLIDSVPSNNDVNTTDANTAISKSNQANSRSIKNERITKGSRVLTWISM